MPESPLAGYETNRSGHHPPHWEGWRVLRTLWLGSGASGLFQEGRRLGDFTRSTEKENGPSSRFAQSVPFVFAGLALLTEVLPGPIRRSWHSSTVCRFPIGARR